MSAGRKAFKIFTGGFAFGVVGSLTFFDNVGYFATVSGKSMQPIFNPEFSRQRDILFLSRWAVRDYDIHRGDVVSVISPHHPREVLIKRVIALEGDTIRTLGYKNRFVVIPEGHCWLEGDHHGVSLDSNYFGPIALGLVHAKASHIVWPPQRYQKVKSCQLDDRKPLAGVHLSEAMAELYFGSDESLDSQFEGGIELFEDDR
ncbi:mitochondrial inner membrane protease subunit 2-like [Diadema antillarum]|uniref:mitochondrial inner membrane protease subunit 2-like n=1 Tax=Diadema antillarum TaxID=105358 RepID=UPI003A8AEFA0